MPVETDKRQAPAEPMEHAARPASVELVFSSELTQTYTKAMAMAHFAPVTTLESKKSPRVLLSRSVAMTAAARTSAISAAPELAGDNWSNAPDAQPSVDSP